MWNRIARTLAQQRGLGLWESARLLAVLNFAIGDATISVYAAKYVYNFWRPITAIRAVEDGNARTVADPEWTSLLTANNHPEYPSAHSYQAGAAAEVLAATFGADTPFAIQSVSLPNITRTFESFSQAAAETGESRIYGGIHFPTGRRGRIETGRHHRSAGGTSGPAFQVSLIETKEIGGLAAALDTVSWHLAGRLRRTEGDVIERRLRRSVEWRYRLRSHLRPIATRPLPKSSLRELPWIRLGVSYDLYNAQLVRALNYGGVRDWIVA